MVFISIPLKWVAMLVTLHILLMSFIWLLTLKLKRILPLN